MSKNINHENLWKILSNTNEWVRFSEGKAIALMASQGVLLGLIVQADTKEATPFTTCELSLLGIAILFNTLSILFSFLCLNPRLKLTGGISPIYFGSIAENFSNSSEYKEHYLQSMDSEQKIINELCGQVFVNSQIASRKFKNVGYSIRCFFVSIIFWIVFLAFMVAG